MKNKISTIIPGIIFVPIIGIVLYNVLRDINDSKLFLEIVALFCCIGAYILTIFAFTPLKSKKNI